MPDLFANTYVALAEHLAALDRVYGRTARCAIALGPIERLDPVLEPGERADSITGLAKWTAARVEETE